MIKRMRDRIGLPVVDPSRTGCGKLIDKLMKIK
jgi:hypothetical protein